MKRTVSTLSVAALAIVLLMMAGRSRTFGAAVEDKPTTAVKIDNFVFSPNPVTVPVGSTIRWTNQDDIPHNVVSDDKSFKSKALDTDETFTYTFTKPGTYTYFCSIHPKMTGKIVVQ
jgi:plastocyanin